MGKMDGSVPGSAFLLLILVLSTVSGNSEGDALNAFKTQLSDPNHVMESWDPTLVNPCTWYNVTCNNENSVTRVDLGNALLSGQLVPQLGQLANLQYLELYSNNISGSIPAELGNLTSLVSLDLFLNNLSGTIPSTLGNLQKLRFLRLGNNKLTGTIPMTLTTIHTLQVLDLSNNRLIGEVPHNGSFSLFTPISFVGNAFEEALSPAHALAPSPALSNTPCPGSTSERAAECNKSAKIDHGVVGLLSLLVAFIFIYEWYGYQQSSFLILHTVFFCSI